MLWRTLCMCPGRIKTANYCLFHTRSVPMKNILFVLSAIMIMCSCDRQNSSLVSIPTDIDSARLLTINTTALIPLETSDSSLIYDINSLELHGNRFIVHSRNYLRSYDIQSGSFLGDVARCGKKEDTFSYIGNLWLEEDTVRFFDSNLSAILSFSPNGTFYGRSYPLGQAFSIEAKPRQYFSLPEIGIFTTNFSNDNTARRNPRYSFYEFGQSECHYVDGREITEPTFLTDGTFIDKENHRLLSWEPLRDTIFEVTKSRVKPLYHVDFGKRALPADIQALPYSADRIKAFNSKTSKPYASLIRYVQIHDGYIYFAFACGEETNFIAAYNTQSGQTSVYHIATPDNKFSQTTFFKITGDSAYFEVRDRKDLLSNPYLYKIALSDLQ